MKNNKLVSFNLLIMFMSNKIRYFENTIPDIGLIVMAKVININFDYNILYVSLLEYMNLEGSIIFSQVVKSKKYKKKNIPCVGKLLLAQVTHIDPTTNHISLSKNNVSSIDISIHEDQFIYSTILNKIAIELFGLYQNFYPENLESLEIFVKRTMWRIINIEDTDDNIDYKKIYHMILNNYKVLFDNSFCNEFQNFATTNFESRIIKNKITSITTLYLCVIENQGIASLQDIFSFDMTDINLIISSPTYTITIIDYDENIINSKLNYIINYIENKILKYKFQYKIISKNVQQKEIINKIKFLAN